MKNEFNAKKGQALKESGMAKAAKNAKAKAWLPMARAFAIKYAKKNGEVTSDIVQLYCPRPDGVNCNCVGGLFKTPYLEHTGDYTLSRRVSAHRRAIGVFRYVGSP